MSGSEKSVVHSEVIDLSATPDQVRAFIFTPERILDYYPMPVEGEILEPGRAIWCRGEMGTSLLELVDAESSDSVVVVKVTTAFGLAPPVSRERIEANVGFTMVEDWALEATADGTRLTKTWRDVTSPGAEPFPLAEAVREGAVSETAKLVAGWNAAAAEG